MIGQYRASLLSPVTPASKQVGKLGVDKDELQVGLPLDALQPDLSLLYPYLYRNIREEAQEKGLV